jgi:hypothetical protein
MGCYAFMACDRTRCSTLWPVVFLVQVTSMALIIGPDRHFRRRESAASASRELSISHLRYQRLISEKVVFEITEVLLAVYVATFQLGRTPISTRISVVSVVASFFVVSISSALRSQDFGPFTDEPSRTVIGNCVDTPSATRTSKHEPFANN